MKNLLFSIITPLYKTPEHKIKRLYKSLINQTYSKWEWIVFDDSPSEHNDSYNFIQNLTKKDNRILLFREKKNSGIIGNVKKMSFSLGKGDILVEVDHDDELVDTCLENLLTAYNYSEDIGFVYGHCCELYEDGENILDYGDNWAFGYGKYIKTIYKNKEYKVAITPNINSKTIRHIVGIPNHVRSWRKNIYNELGGHNKDLRVADDYELFIRTFLYTKIAKINAFTYIQYFERNSSNTQFDRNAEIQKTVYDISKKYNEQIHERFIRCKIDDFSYKNIKFSENKILFNTQNTQEESYINIIIPEKLLKNNLMKMKMIDKYAYSRVYDIHSTIEYKKNDHYSNFIKWLLILTNCQSYLELGIEYSVNIRQVRNFVKVCVGVDIVDIKDKEKIDFYHMTTNEFFSKNERTFDIIFIDADHNFEQVKVDFDNSLKILNKFGIIILHDTDPIIPELLEKKYCSDSYKIIDYISKNQELNLITLPMQETGMTLVMRKKDRRINEFINNSISVVESVTTESIVDHQHIVENTENLDKEIKKPITVRIV